MIVNVVECLSGAQRAKGLVVIVDVFRSTTLGCFLAAGGAAEYIVTDSLDRARAMAAERGGKVIGELVDVPPREFDYLNSPALIEQADIRGETLIHVTNAGTRGLMVCTEADEVIMGSFVNAQAVVDYVRARNPEVVTLVAMGTGGVMRAQEDMMCAMYIKNEIEEYPNSFKTLKNFLRDVDTAAKFFDETRDDCPEADFDLCMDLDRFDFVLKGEPVDGGVRLNRVAVAGGTSA
ncbi:2-phosphosulfolactate phosphatase [Desulfovibrio sp. Huiquan2017]|uniref:2-phosphosulfolactate phosphatase n=1 Tax=Desulfovibrio sp. Huiquan2017 TaxID=2816861 RepID=UPI001A91E419|nr:2-phosphosulfolactate phosphatase [Desulfovibrio sp. Huiquan2017]